MVQTNRTQIITEFRFVLKILKFLGGIWRKMQGYIFITNIPINKNQFDYQTRLKQILKKTKKTNKTKQKTQLKKP